MKNVLKSIFLAILIVCSGCSVEKRLQRKQVRLEKRATKKFNKLIEKYPFLIDSAKTTVSFDTTIAGDSVSGSVELNDDSTIVIEAAREVVEMFETGEGTQRQVREVLQRVRWQELIPHPIVIDTGNVKITLSQFRNTLKWEVQVDDVEIRQQKQVQTFDIKPIEKHVPFPAWKYPWFWIMILIILVLLTILLFPIIVRIIAKTNGLG